MRIEHVETEWGNPQSYAQASCFQGLIYVCGQLGAVPGGEEVPFEPQAELALTRLLDVVEKAGGGPQTILKVNCYLASFDDLAVYDAIYRKMFSFSPKPARTTVQIARFVEPILIEVDAIAATLQAADA